MKNYYEILQVKNFADIEVINASYKALAKKYHPDINKTADPNIMAEINNAFDVLSDLHKKNAYDRQLEDYLYCTVNNTNNPTVENDFIYKTSEKECGRNDRKIKIGFIRIFRLFISIPIGLLVGYIGNLIVMGLLDTDGSWSFFIYIIYGAILGLVIKNVSGSSSTILGLVGGLICVITLLLPYYEFLCETLYLYNYNYNQVEIYTDAAIELVQYLFGNGIIRAVAIIFTPITTCSIISE